VFFTPDQIGGDAYRWLLSGTLGLTLLSVGIIDSVTERRQSELSDRARVQTRIASAFFVLLLAPAGQFMPAWAFLGFMALCCLAQVFFDLTMAPLAADPHAAHHEHPVVLEATPLAQPAATQSPPRKRRTLAEAVRKGTPNELKRDLYVHLMEGSWTQLFATFILIFLFSNVVFAALYLLEPGSVSNVHDDSFIHAFAFSVQTMATIGYGAMAPDTTYAHVLVTVEALLSMLGVALATGLLFAKVSRPRSSVLFSKPVVIHERHGVPTLSFRVGNARGNEVVEASLRVVVTRDEISPEGHHLRRLHDLTLERENTPLFVLTWSVLHPIDENSPFHGVNPDNLENSFVTMVVTLTGHDSTFAQTVHARHMYFPEDLRFGHRFVDVLSNLEDGRLLLDFDRFHDTVPVSEPGDTASHAASATPGAPRPDEPDEPDDGNSGADTGGRVDPAT
jgi:inward rectifier potassium channel